MSNENEKKSHSEEDIDTSREVLEIDEKDSDNELIIEEEVKKPLSKNEEAKELIKNSTDIISQADSDVASTKTTVFENVNRFEESKNTLLNSTFTQSQILLERASYDYSKAEANEPFEISLGAIGEKVKVSNITSGGFTGFILAILAAVATVIGWLFISSAKVGVTLNLPEIPAQADLDTIFKWIGGGMTGGNGDPLFGMVTVGLTALVVAWVVYKVRVSTKENKNYRVANKTFAESNSYVERQKEAKSEMERIDEHIKEATPVIENYRILLDEQNSKLQRILHVEGALEDNSEYHSSSKQTMQDSEDLMRRVEKLITIAVTKDGILNEESTYALMEAKALYDSYIAKIYV